LLGLFDADLSFDTVLKYPQIYSDCIQNKYFTTQRFWFWLSNGVFEAITCTIMSLLLIDNYNKDTGVVTTFWESGFLCLTAVIIICNTKLLFNLVHQINIWIVLWIILSILSWFGVAAVVSTLLSLFFDWYDVFDVATSQGVFWLALIVMVSAVSIKDLFIIFFQSEFGGDLANVSILREHEAGYRDQDNNETHYNNLTDSENFEIEAGEKRIQT